MRIAPAFVFERSNVQTQYIREKMVGHLRNINEVLAKRVQDGLGLPEVPPAAATAIAARDLPPSPALALIAKLTHTLQGRCMGNLVADGSDGTASNKLKKAIMKKGATVKVVAPTPMIKGKDGSMRAIDGQLTGTPSVVFDAVASMLDPKMGKQRSKDGAPADWFRDAFGHLQAIAACQGTQPILDAAIVVQDEGVFEPKDVEGFLKVAKTRQWDRETKVRTLA